MFTVEFRQKGGSRIDVNLFEKGKPLLNITETRFVDISKGAAQDGSRLTDRPEGPATALDPRDGLRPLLPDERHFEPERTVEWLLEGRFTPLDAILGRQDDFEYFRRD